MSYDFTTAILRFRDLVTQPQDTIRLHRDVIVPHGFVWWGWWNKAGERIPDDAFRRLHESAKSGLDLYLADSGTGKVYRARCDDVHWTSTGERDKSPDPHATPGYYRDQQYLAWFRFTRIDDEEPTAVTRFTYCRVDAFFRTGRSAFDRFYGKRVYSVEELRQQDRTIWFVRPATEADPTHEIALLNTRALAPTDFVTSYVETPSRTLLWVSDPHFTSSGHHGFPRQSDPARTTLARAIEEACRCHRIETIAGVILSGDHQLPDNVRPEDLRRYPAEHYQLRGTLHRHTPKGELKPNADVLRSILADCGVAPEQAIYVGDSEIKDIAMANAVGVTSVLAKYGKAQSRPEYNVLREVTHWTEADVAREKAIAEGGGRSDLTPTFTLDDGIAELLDLFEFVAGPRPPGRPAASGGLAQEARPESPATTWNAG